MHAPANVAAARPRRVRRLLTDLVRSSAGVSAVEFAILSPFLVLGCFGTIDTGMAVYERMMISQVLPSSAKAITRPMPVKMENGVIQSSAPPA